jgi:hypothetical protein
MPAPWPRHGRFLPCSVSGRHSPNRRHSSVLGQLAANRPATRALCRTCSLDEQGRSGRATIRALKGRGSICFRRNSSRSGGSRRFTCAGLSLVVRGSPPTPKISLGSFESPKRVRTVRDPRAGSASERRRSLKKPPIPTSRIARKSALDFGTQLARPTCAYQAGGEIRFLVAFQTVSSSRTEARASRRPGSMPTKFRRLSPRRRPSRRRSRFLGCSNLALASFAFLAFLASLASSLAARRCFARSSGRLTGRGPGPLPFHRNPAKEGQPRDRGRYELADKSRTGRFNPLTPRRLSSACGFKTHRGLQRGRRRHLGFVRLAEELVSGETGGDRQVSDTLTSTLAREHRVCGRVA